MSAPSPTLVNVAPLQPAPARPGGADLQARLAAALVEHAPVNPATEPRLRAAIGMLAGRPGKLVRAQLAYATATAHGVAAPVGLQLAVAVEYYHLASLILDDLPCMDDAAVRRGQPCVHRVYGEATAVLAALAFINRAYATFGEAFASFPPAVRRRAHAALEASLGPNGLVGGQARDLGFARGPRTTREVGRVALAKTGTTFRLGLAIPALLARPSAAEQHALNALCTHWALAFQALDDLQDVLGNSVDTQKTTQRDRALTRPNLALALGVSASRVRINRLLTLAARQVDQLGRLRPAWGYLHGFQRSFAEAAAPLAGKLRRLAA
ncbi:polyprenyl synthetase family protein [Opitutus sp. ER46]|uniref:polyprenyl synthetase family protein n=1 Tax=Opitutus sp. ER46 TaxID=2161864 RepID=UPI000D3147BA|nr:polyprenyl synthetase family protein [Opitutus sp. ER46]PTX92674.1 hypothetical protein DB354_15235 [Opitutus sp. ER46]